jgi:peptidoglycan hydrolase-like protein with peptidoglycan-binding domain
MAFSLGRRRRTSLGHESEQPVTEQPVTEQTVSEAPTLAPPVTQRGGRRIMVISGLAVAVVAVLAIVAVAGVATSVDTHTVGRGDLTERIRTKGSLGYTNIRDLGSTLAGIVTSVQTVGSVVTLGTELFRIDNFPVVLFHGALPMWRPFADGMEKGPDVMQLEQSLAELGYFDREPDNEFTWRTAEAIKKWQQDIGVEATGTIAPGQIVFLPSDVRIAAQKATIGSPAAAAIVSISGTVKQVTVNLDTNLAAIATVGASVSVVLPDGSSIDGTIESVGAPEEKDDGTGAKKLKLPTVISLGDSQAVANFDNVTVTVVITKVKSTNALLIPVLALLALPGGGSAVEVLREPTTTSGAKQTGATTEQVTVELGAFADGMVEVISGDLAEGDRVVVGK